MSATSAVLTDLGTKLRNGVALRRATRVAVTVPVVVATLLSLPSLQTASSFGVFACVAMLLFSDFGGPLRERFVAYLLTTLAGIPLVLIGITFGQSIPGASIVMFLVALLVGLAAVLRGLFASAQTVLLLATVLAVTSAQPGTQVPAVISWSIGGLAAAVAALVLWPARPSQGLAIQLGTLYRAAARAVRYRWADPDPAAHEQALTDLDTQLADFRGHYDGNLLRPSGLTNSDRAIAQLADLVVRLRAYQKWVDVTVADASEEPELQDINRSFATIVADELDLIAEDVYGRDHQVSADRIRVARDEHLTRLTQWVAEHRGDLAGGAIRERLDDAFPLRLSSISTELAGASANPSGRFHDAVLVEELEDAQQGIGARLTRNLSWESPWFRNALRGAIALALSVALAKALGLDHGFWIVLGTLTALRFDALGTGRTAVQALLGTVVGVTLGAGLILAVGSNETMWWILLPVALLMAGYTPGNFSLAAGQAGFSVAVIVLFSLLYPATLATAELRLLDVAIGLGVSLAISAVMWPRGVISSLHNRMAEAIAAATDHLLMAIDFVAGGAVDRQMLDVSRERSAVALDRAREAYDLSIAQKPPKTVPIEKWFRVAMVARHVDVAAHLIPGISRIVADRGGSRTIPLPLTGAVLETAHEVRNSLRGVVEAWRDQTTREMTASDLRLSEAMAASGRIQAIQTGDSIDRLRTAIDGWLDEPSDWDGDLPDPRPAMVAWVADWNAFVSWNAKVLRRALTDSAAAPTP